MSLSFVMLGDIVGRPGRMAVQQLLPEIRNRWQPDLVIANAENSCHGSGLTPKQYNQLRSAGLNGMTLGDHAYRRSEIIPVLENEPNLIRPTNLAAGARGRTLMKLQSPDGSKRPLYIFTVLGRLFMSLQADNPFECVDRVLKEIPESDPLVLVEIHAEATSEKQAISRHLDGRVSAVLGTHTHVPTADACILPGGTAFMCDLGMSGPFDSIIGRRVDRVLSHLTTSMATPFDVATGDPKVCGAYVEIDERTGHAEKIERIELSADTEKPPFSK